MAISASERSYLRDIAKKYMENARLPVMEERKQLWFDHNEMRRTRPPILFETGTFCQDIMPPLKCQSDDALGIESKLLLAIANHELIGDDQVVPPCFTVGWDTYFNMFDLHFEREAATEDDEGMHLAYHVKHPCKDTTKLFDYLRPTVLTLNRESTLAWKRTVEDAIGDIVPVVMSGPQLWVCLANLTWSLLGTEALMMAVAEHPEIIAEFHRRAKDEYLAYCRWLEREHLISLNNDFSQVGSGGSGWTHDLPAPDFNGQARLKDLWIHINAQEMVGVSPRQYEEVLYPFYAEIASAAGQVYYGCCEPVHELWARCLHKLPNLKCVAITPWCSEEIMGEALRGTKFIYSHKPNPGLIGVPAVFDEEAFADSIRKTLTIAKGCQIQFIFRDIYTLQKDRARAGRAVRIIRELSEKLS